MPIEMIGWIAPRVPSEIIPPSGPPFNAEVIAETARMHEQAGFDRVLIGYFSYAPDGFLVGAHAAAVTSRLQLLLAHRPGFVAPTVAVRKLDTLDHLSGGRTAVHLVAGGNDAEQARDGAFTDHDARYRRTHECVTLLKRTWTEPAPLEHQGEFYRVVGAHAVATGAWGNSTALVGTPEVVAEALVAYYDLGATSLLIRGYDPLPDALEYGRELIPRVRAWWLSAMPLRGPRLKGVACITGRLGPGRRSLCEASL